METDEDYRNRLVQHPKCGVYWAEDLGTMSGKELDNLGELWDCPRKGGSLVNLENRVAEVTGNLHAILKELSSEDNPHAPFSCLDKMMKALNVSWIVSTKEDNEGAGEFGIQIGDLKLWYYKDSTPMIGNSRPSRKVEKREFGEVLKTYPEMRKSFCPR